MHYRQNTRAIIILHIYNIISKPRMYIIKNYLSKLSADIKKKCNAFYSIRVAIYGINDEQYKMFYFNVILKKNIFFM